MGYGHYTLPDGREAGYMVVAECDAEGCTAEIDRGLDFLCGESPDGHRDPDEYGCGKYFCAEHGNDHDCPAGPCGAYEADRDLWCHLRKGHDEVMHQDRRGGAFVAVEED